MKLIEMVGAALLSCGALVSVGVNAQQTVPVSCSWTITSAPFSATQQTTVQQCRDSNGLAIANRTFVFSSPFTSAPVCTLTTITNISNPSGNCLSPSFVKTIPTNCNSGAYIGASCANSMSSPGFGNAVQTVCGSTSCQIRYEYFGSINGCGQQSPYTKAYCY